MTRRNLMIDDPERPFRLKPGVRYRVVKDSEGRLVVRAVPPPQKAQSSASVAFVKDRFDTNDSRCQN